MSGFPGFSGSYETGDVTFLLTPMAMPTVTLAEKERLLRSGTVHYSQLLSEESPPSATYLAAYDIALTNNARRLACDIAALANTIAARPFAASVKRLVLASLVRAGTPIGILLTRQLRRLGVRVDHYSISIIRDRGIDRAAIDYIRRCHPSTEILFVDGWTGKGAIAAELRGSKDLNELGIIPFLIVVADPAGQADLAATAEDYVIPSGILNGIVSGLVSRSVLTDEITPGVFHGCRILNELRTHDVSRDFIQFIDREFSALTDAPFARWTDTIRLHRAGACVELINNIKNNFGILNNNSIKPGIAESTRAILRRSPKIILVNDLSDSQLTHILYLARERNTEVRAVGDLHGYKAVAILD